MVAKVIPDGTSARDALALSLVEGIGPILQHRLVQHFGSPAAVLAADVPALCQVAGVGSELARRIRESRTRECAVREWERCQAAGVAIATWEDLAYPPLLREIPDPPQALHFRGKSLEQYPLVVAIVGTRHATPYGRQQAQLLASSLARAGFAIASGLARGIDAAAHRATLDAGGETIAVLACGVETIYPPEHASLAQEIATQGTLVSEITASGPRRGAFPRRNRIITGLSLGVVVVEASLRSGALISARHALEQGREVLVLPGRVDSHASQGCHALLRDGATLITCAEHVVEALGPLAKPVKLPNGNEIHQPRELQLDPQELQVLLAISREGCWIDEVVRHTGLPTGRVLATLSVLELRKLVRREGAARVARVP